MKINILNLHPAYFDELTQLQYACFPTVAEEEYYRQEHFASHHRIFPEGSFVALAEDRSGEKLVVGFASGLFTDFDFAHPNHSSSQLSR